MLSITQPTAARVALATVSPCPSSSKLSAHTVAIACGSSAAGSAENFEIGIYPVSWLAVVTGHFAGFDKDGRIASCQIAFFTFLPSVIPVTPESRVACYRVLATRRVPNWRS